MESPSGLGYPSGGDGRSVDNAVIQERYNQAFYDGYSQDPSGDMARLAGSPPRGSLAHAGVVRGDSPRSSRRRWDDDASDRQLLLTNGGQARGAPGDRRVAAPSDLASDGGVPRRTAASLSAARFDREMLSQRQRGTVASVAHSDTLRSVAEFQDEALRAGEARREAELQRDVLRLRGENEDLRRQLKDADVRHREELAKKLNEFRRVQREEEAQVCRELREVKSERSRLEQEVDLLRIQLADVQREAEQAKLDLDQQREKELAEMTAKMEAAEGAKGDAEGSQAEVEKSKQSVKDLKIECAKLRGRLAVLERAGARASADEVDALKQEAVELRKERDDAEDELHKLKKDLNTIERIKGDKLVGLEKELEELREKLGKDKLEVEAAKGAATDRTAFLEAKVCALQDTCRKLKDHRDKYMTALDIREYDKLEESELEVKKARDDRREALALVDSVQQELVRVREAVSQDSRRKLGGGRDFDAEVKKLVQRANTAAKKHYSVP